MIADVSYKEVLTLARQLEIPDQLRLMQALLSGVRSEISYESPQHSILELKGVGREIWQNLDVAGYLREERASWDG
jgi:hypothetical protein